MDFQSDADPAQPHSGTPAKSIHVANPTLWTPLEIIRLSRIFGLASELWRCVADRERTCRCEPQATEDTPLAGMKLAAPVQNTPFEMQVTEKFVAVLRIAVDGVPVMADIRRNFIRYEGQGQTCHLHVVQVAMCEGGVDVVSVVTPLVRGGAQVLHGDQVVELSVLLEVHEKEEEGEDGEGQIEVESERGELKERRTCTWMT